MIMNWICSVVGTAESIVTNSKNWLCLLIGATGTVISRLLGGWSTGMTTLMICMGIDCISAFILAAIFHKSPKSKNGGLESHACLKGLIRKVVMLLVVAVGYQMDVIMGSDYIKNAVIIAFIVNEVISFLENAGLMGIPLPEVLNKAIDVMKEKEDEENE